MKIGFHLVKYTFTISLHRVDFIFSKTMGAILRSILFSLWIIFSSAAHAFMPQAGTWVLTSEVNGLPGRGIALDVQNNIFTFSLYAYESSGQPTFYAGAGTLSATRGGPDLPPCPGGRYLGGASQSASLEKSVGQVRVRFTSGVTGFAQLPGEAEVAISRYNFGYAAVPSSLNGIWSLSSLGSLGLYADVVSLTVQGSATSNGNGLVMSSNGLFGCEHQVRGGYAGGVICVKINTSGQLLAAYRFVYSVNEGEGYSNISGSADQVMWVRRLSTASGGGTGIAVGEDNLVTAENEARVAGYIQQISQ